MTYLEIQRAKELVLKKLADATSMAEVRKLNLWWNRLKELESLQEREMMEAAMASIEARVQARKKSG